MLLKTQSQQDRPSHTIPNIGTACNSKPFDCHRSGRWAIDTWLSGGFEMSYVTAEQAPSNTSASVRTTGRPQNRPSQSPPTAPRVIKLLRLCRKIIRGRLVEINGSGATCSPTRRTATCNVHQDSTRKKYGKSFGPNTQNKK